MRSFEIFVEPELSQLPDDAATARGSVLAGPRSGRRQRLDGIPASTGSRVRPNEVLDLFIHGANVTARVAERHASLVLRDLAWVLTDLVRIPRGKRIVRFFKPRSAHSRR